jgi:hypothetical protein
MSKIEPASQLELFTAPTARTPEALGSALSGAAGRPVALTITRNRVSMISMCFQPGGIRLRLHHAFLGAPERLIRSIGEYLRTRSKTAWGTIGEYVRTIEPEPRAAGRRVRRTTACGRVHDLLAMADKVNRLYFSGRLKCRIEWGRGVRRRRRGARSRTVRFGCYLQSDDLVRINRLLDDPRVPVEFVEYIVFHEMLHAAVPSLRRGGWRHHHTAYRRIEQQYPDLNRMRELSTRLVDVLTAPS